MNLTAPLKFNKKNLLPFGFIIFGLIVTLATSYFIFSYFRRLAIKSEELSSNLKSVSLQKSDLDKKVSELENAVNLLKNEDQYKKNKDLQTEIASMGPFFWYSLKDSGINKDTPENFFGLLRNDWSKKPAYDVFRNAILSSQ